MTQMGGIHGFVRSAAEEIGELNTISGPSLISKPRQRSQEGRDIIVVLKY